MPNLVPIQTISAMRDMLYVAILTDPIRNRRADPQDSSGYVAQGAITRAYAVGGSIFGLPDRPTPPELLEPLRKAPSYTNPNKSDTDVKLAQFVRITGLKGTSVLSRADYRTGKQALGRMVTAQGKATRNVPNHLSGEYPDERCAVVPTDGTDMTISGDEIRYLRRYRDGMRGKAFSRSMMLEAAERDAAWWRAANPWIPCDSHGIPWKGASYKRMDGIGERLYSDGEMLTEKRLRWIADMEKQSAQLERDAEIARLEAEQIRDERETRTKKVRAEREAVRAPIRF